MTIQHQQKLCLVPGMLRRILLPGKEYINVRFWETLLPRTITSSCRIFESKMLLLKTHSHTSTSRGYEASSGGTSIWEKEGNIPVKDSKNVKNVQHRRYHHIPNERGWVGKAKTCCRKGRTFSMSGQVTKSPPPSMNGRGVAELRK